MGTKFEIFKYEVKVVRVTYQSHGITKEIDAETGSVIYALPNNAEIEFTDTRFNKDHTIKDTTKGSGKGHNATLFSGVSGDRRFIFNVTKSSRDVRYAAEPSANQGNGTRVNHVCGFSTLRYCSL